MTKHQKIYFDYFNLDSTDAIFCEICGKIATDIHHIEYRGMGGRDVDYIENLMALCRSCHNNIHSYPAKYTKKFLKFIHNQNLKKMKRLIFLLFFIPITLIGQEDFYSNVYYGPVYKSDTSFYDLIYDNHRFIISENNICINTIRKGYCYDIISQYTVQTPSLETPKVETKLKVIMTDFALFRVYYVNNSINEIVMMPNKTREVLSYEQIRTP